jgi:hypothetical protein
MPFMAHESYGVNYASDEIWGAYSGFYHLCAEDEVVFDNDDNEFIDSYDYFPDLRNTDKVTQQVEFEAFKEYLKDFDLSDAERETLINRWYQYYQVLSAGEVEEIIERDESPSLEILAKAQERAMLIISIIGKIADKEIEIAALESR